MTGFAAVFGGAGIIAIAKMTVSVNQKRFEAFPPGERRMRRGIRRKADSEDRGGSSAAAFCSTKQYFATSFQYVALRDKKVAAVHIS